MIRVAYTRLWGFRTRTRIALTNTIRQCETVWRSILHGHPSPPPIANGCCPPIWKSVATVRKCCKCSGPTPVIRAGRTLTRSSLALRREFPPKGGERQGDGGYGRSSSSLPSNFAGMRARPILPLSARATPLVAIPFPRWSRVTENRGVNAAHSARVRLR
jgi:hypothetical protein